MGQQVLAQDPDHANANYRAGRILYELNDLGAAKDSLEKTLERNPNHALAHYYLAHVLYYLNHLEGSETAYRRTIELKPDHINAYIDLVNVLYELNKPKEFLIPHYPYSPRGETYSFMDGHPWF